MQEMKAPKPKFKGDLKKFLRELELYYILEALQDCENNRNQASKKLGLNRTTLVEKMRYHGILHTTPKPILDYNK